MGMTSLVVWGMLVAAPAADVQVQLLRGDTVSGELIAVSAEKISVSVAGTSQVIPAPEALAVDFSPAMDQETPHIWLDLLDGSRVIAAGLSLSGGKATIEFLGGEKLTDVPARAIRAIRFRAADDDRLNASWNDILAGTRSGDVLVLRKSATREIEEEGQTKTVTTLALDELEGAVLAIGPESVKFDFDGDKVDVKREKLEGVVLFQPVKRELPAANLRLIDVAMSQWRLKSIELKDDQLTGVTPAGVMLTLPLARVQRLDFSSGNVALLASLPMENSEASVALLPKGLSAGALDWFAPSAGKRPGTVRNDSTAKPNGKVALTGKSQVTYRTPEGFRWLRAGLVLAGKQGQGSDVDVIVVGDGKVLAKHSLLAADERKPLTLEVDVANIRRVTLQAVPLAGQGFGALVDFQDARFTK